MKVRYVLVIACLLTAVVSWATARISPMATLPDGSHVEIEGHYFMEGEWPTLSVVDTEEPVTWCVSSYEFYWVDGKLSEIPKLVECYASELPSLSFAIPYQQIKWEKQHIWDDEEYETHSEIEVYAKVNGEIVDQVNLKFRLAPSQIKVLDVTMEYDPSWTFSDWGYWEDENGETCWAAPHYTLEVKRCDLVLVCYSSNICIHDFQLNDWELQPIINIREYFFRKDAEVEGDIWKITRILSTSWGEWFRFEALNDYGGTITPDTLCTTDYFTDPYIQEKIKQFYEEDLKIHTKVDDIMGPAEEDTPQYFNLQGLPIANPRKGELVIRKRGSVTDKIVY